MNIYQEIYKSAAMLICHERLLNPFQMVEPPEGTSPFKLVPVWEGVAEEIRKHHETRISNELEGLNLKLRSEGRGGVNFKPSSYYKALEGNVVY